MAGSLDELPSPYLSGVFDLSSARSVELVMSRGCANSCSYCAINESPLRYFSYGRIKSELEYVLRRAPRLETALITVADMYHNEELAPRVLRLLRKAYESRGLRSFFYVNVASLHKEKLLKLSDCPGFGIEVGVQSVKTGVLRLCGRLPDPGMIKSNVERLKALAPSAEKSLGLINFLPGDDADGCLDSLEWAVSTGLEVAVNHLRVIPGTRLHGECSRLGVKVSPEYPYFVTETASVSRAEVKRVSRITGDVFFAMRVLSLSPSLRKDFFKRAGAAGGSRPHVLLACSLAAWWSGRPATSGLAEVYRRNVAATGSLDHNPQTGSFSRANLAAFRGEYALFLEFMRRRGGAV